MPTPAEHDDAPSWDANAETRVVESTPLRHLLSVPRAARAAPGRTPVLCFLHGYDEGAPMEIRRALTTHGPLRPGSWPAGVDRCIVVAPQLPLAGDAWHLHADAVARLVDDVARMHGGDPTRAYLTGFSFGGNGVFDLAIRQPGRWAALWAVDPTRVPTRPVEAPVWLSVGEIARRRVAGFVRALGLEPAPAGGEPPPSDRVYLDEGGDHVGSATTAYRDARVYRWLLSRRLRAGPTGDSAG